MSRKLLQSVAMFVAISHTEDDQLRKKHERAYFKTPVFIHHESDEGGVCFSFMYNETVYRFQRVGQEVYGPFEPEDWELLRAEYRQADLDWANVSMYAHEFAATKGDKELYSPYYKSPLKLIEGKWYALADGEVIEAGVQEPEEA